MKSPPDPRPVEGDRGVPGDLFEAHHLLEPGGGQPRGEPVAVPPVDLVLEEPFQELVVAQVPAAGRGGPVEQDGEQAAQAETRQAADAVRDDFGRGNPPPV